MPKVFIVEDEASIAKLILYWVKDKWGYDAEIFENGEKVLPRLSDRPDLILLDIMLPGLNGIEVLKKIKQSDEHLPVIILSAQGSIEVALEAVRSGAYDYFPKPIDAQRLEPSIKNAIRNYELLKELHSLKETVTAKYSFDNIISADGKMQDVFRLVSKVLNNDITVLIYGESGTGKELISRAIHFNGARKDKPFVVVNCASIPRELLESELFGHEKGSFTGAHQKKLGKFEIANGGTIFLDEIGELPIEMQVKLLRVIQSGEFDRLGGTQTLHTDVRIIAATNRDLEKAVAEKTFREDLFYRLNVFPIRVPPLRERREDLPLLVEYFVREYAKKIGREINVIPRSVLSTLENYNWPGNIRELENIIERGVILSHGHQLEIGNWFHGESQPEEEKQLRTLTELERAHILKVLDSTRWRVSGPNGAAQILGINPQTLVSRMKKLGIQRMPANEL